MLFNSPVPGLRLELETPAEVTVRWRLGSTLLWYQELLVESSLPEGVDVWALVSEEAPEVLEAPREITFEKPAQGSWRFIQLASLDSEQASSVARLIISHRMVWWLDPWTETLLVGEVEVTDEGDVLLLDGEAGDAEIYLDGDDVLADEDAAPGSGLRVVLSGNLNFLL
jgi:hypothetical protein